MDLRHRRGRSRASRRHRSIDYVERIAAALRRLDLAPERGRPRDDIRPGLRIIGVEHRVTIAFSVNPDQVTILRVFYGGADWERQV